MSVKEIVAGQFDAVLANATQAILVKFWGDDCAKCAAMVPILEKFRETSAGELEIVSCYLTPQDDIVRRYGLQGIPTLMLFEDGEPIHRHTGMMDLQALHEAFILRERL